MKDALTSIGHAARLLFRQWGALALFNALYAALLLTLYLFVSTKEATAPQLAFTALLALAAPLLFFILQAALVRYARAEGVSAGRLLRGALANFWKLLLFSLPLVALGFGVAYLLNKLQGRFPLPEADAARLAAAAAAAAEPSAHTVPPPPVRWQTVVFPALRLLLLGVVLPLVAIQLWIALGNEGVKATLRKIHRVVARAFSPRAVFVYAAGLLAFGMMPYFLVFTRTPIGGAWGELLIFGLRLALAFAFTLWGWAVTLGALTRLNYGDEAPPGAATNEAAAVPSSPRGETQGAQA